MYFPQIQKPQAFAHGSLGYISIIMISHTAGDIQGHLGTSLSKKISTISFCRGIIQIRPTKTNNKGDIKMNLNKTAREITTYALEDELSGFFVDVENDVSRNGYINFFLYHKSCGIKDLMFGIPQVDAEDVEVFITANVEDYIESYKEEYML
jgi:hypothetical protein